MIFFPQNSTHFWLHCGLVRTLAPTIGYLSYIWRRKECQRCIPFLHHHYFGNYRLLESTLIPPNPESIGERGILSQYSDYKVFHVLHPNLFTPGPWLLWISLVPFSLTRSFKKVLKYMPHGDF